MRDKSAATFGRSYRQKQLDVQARRLLRGWRKNTRTWMRGLHVTVTLEQRGLTSVIESPRKR